MSDDLDEVAVLRDKLYKEKSYRMEAEEERNFLLADNTRLRAELDRLKQSVATQASLPPPRIDTAKFVSTIKSNSKSYAHILNTKVNEACGGKNAVCTSFMPYKNVHGLHNMLDADILLCGGVDAQVSGYDSVTRAHLFSIKLSAPVLSIDVHGASIACGMMDGSHTIINVQAKEDAIIASVAVEHNSDSPDPSNTCGGNVGETKVVRKHTKYVILVRWSPDGRFLVTVSHDLQVILYRRSPRTDCMEEFKIFMCANTPESACFVAATNFSNTTDECDDNVGVSQKSSKIGDYLYTLGSKNKNNDKFSEVPVRVIESDSTKSVGGESVNDSDENDNINDTGEDIDVDTWETGTDYDLVLGMRDTAHLTYINCTTFHSKEVSLNENAWDTHASFVPLYLAPSPCGGRLLVATDKHMHIVLRTGTNERIQILSGHSCGDFGKPVVQWDWRGEYVFCNSDNDNLVYVYCMQLGKIVNTLAGHGKGLLRGLAAHPHKSQLLSVSYDRAMILWTA